MFSSLSARKLTTTISR